MFEDIEEGHLDGEEPVVYRYNREKRIENAPKIVQEYYAGGLRPVRGLKVLFANKSNRFVFMALIFFIAAAWIYTGLNNTRSFAKINDISLELQSFVFEEEVYSTLKIVNKKLEKEASKNGNANPEKKNLLSPQKIEADFFIINSDKQVSDKQSLSMVYESGEEYLRTKCHDYDIIRVDVIVSVDGIKKELSANVKR